MKQRILKLSALSYFIAMGSPALLAQSEAPDLKKMIPILNQEFMNGLNRYDGRTGLWSTQSPRGTLMTNAAETIFIDPVADDLGWSAALPTLTVTDQGLSIRTVPLNDSDLGTIRAYMQRTKQGNRAAKVKYATGKITTAETWAQVYGWFEIDAQIPRGKGRWPAFWLNFAGQGWPPEIDIFEAYGAGIAAPTPKDGQFNTAVLFDNLNGDLEPVHKVDITNPYGETAKTKIPRVKERNGRDIYTLSKRQVEETLGADIYGQINTYAALWTKDEIVFYFGPNRDSLREIYRTPTPDDVNDPMYIIANDQFTAQGGWWPADKDLDAVLNPENDYLIRAIRAFALSPELVINMAQGDSAYDPRRSIIHDTAGDDLIAPGGGFDVLKLSGGADEIRISRGREGTLIEGFGTDDTIVLEGFPFDNSADAYGRLTQVDDDVWLSSGSDPFWPQSIILRDTDISEVGAAQIISRWPVARDIWGLRADIENRPLLDDNMNGQIIAPTTGGWLNDKGRPSHMIGGPGPERYLASNGQSRIEEPANGGIDTLIAWGNWILPNNVERGILRGTNARLVGTALDDRLEAEGRGNFLAGGAGSDLYVISNKAHNTTIKIDHAAGNDRVRGLSSNHSLLIAPSLWETRDLWETRQIDEGALFVFNATQSILIEGLRVDDARAIMKLR